MIVERRKWFQNFILNNGKEKTMKNKHRFRNIVALFAISAGLITLVFTQHGTAQEEQLGVVNFPISCNEQAQQQFQTGLAQLHHMMYEQARPHFEAAAKADPSCAMAHWGIAMTSFQPLWHPTSPEGLERGKGAVAKARELGAPTEREKGYIAAVEAFFTDPEPPGKSPARDHEARVKAWLEAQRELHESYPEDVDAAAFYALAEVCYAMTQFSPHEERDFTRELRAGGLIEEYFDAYPEHPGLHHYLLHAYDSSKLAHKAEDVAREYDKLAPDAIHAQHMPSHIFVRLGHWEEAAEWDESAADAARREMEDDFHATAHYVHSLDYMMYAYLQMNDKEKARETLERVQEVEEIWAAAFAAYNTAAPQARYYLEQQMWEDAARLEPGKPAVLDWEDFPAAEAIFYYARGIGAARSGDLEQAEIERDEIHKRVESLRAADDTYWAYMTEALGKAVEAWILYEQGETEKALSLMSDAADLEDSMDKHPTTPGEVLPVRELYGELLIKEGHLEEARAAFEASLERTPNRRNALAGLKLAEDS
jgi:tetratricopeptide (TPR) repeat protein